VGSGVPEVPGPRGAGGVRVRRGAPGHPDDAFDDGDGDGVGGAGFDDGDGVGGAGFEDADGVGGAGFEDADGFGGAAFGGGAAGGRFGRDRFGGGLRAHADPGIADEDELVDEPAVQPTSAGDSARVARSTASVIVVDGRPRYHLRGCTHLVGTVGERVPAREAVELGFTPCGRCEPDTALLAYLHRNG
jgi:hypothetical protein